MAREFKKIDDGSVTHSHEEGEAERMSLDELRQHLMLKHAWTLGQVQASRSTEDYVRSWHRNDHVPLRRAE
jgi:hypothetical protein